jgi:Flp pilus assembly pilin Flp
MGNIESFLLRRTVASVSSRLVHAVSSLRAFAYLHARDVAVMLCAPRRSVVLAVARSRRRGAGMLEYALIALISIAIFFAIRTPLTEFFTSLTERIDTEINEDGETPGLGE